MAILLWMVLEYYIECDSMIANNIVDKYNLVMLSQSGIFRRKKITYEFPKHEGYLGDVLLNFTDEYFR
jgi:hypothetical protein